MRPRTLFAGAALTAALALLTLPGLAGSATPTPSRSPQAAAFQAVIVDSRQDPSIPSTGSLAAGLRSAGAVGAEGVFPEPGTTEVSLPSRARVGQPAARGGFDWKPPRDTLTGIATFYDGGTTAMRLPQGTVIRVCGGGGCLERVVTDYGPSGGGRIIDLYRPDFFAICGCASWSGTTSVTVYVY